MSMKEKIIENAYRHHEEYCKRDILDKFKKMMDHILNRIEMIWIQLNHGSTWDDLLVEHMELVKLHNNDCLQY